MKFFAGNQLTNLFRNTWAYRGYIASSVKREFQVRYRNSLLGAAWNILNPLAMVMIYTVVFSQVMHARLPGNARAFDYSIYLCAGVITWGLFSEIISRSQTVFLEHANLIKKLNFPRLCLPVIVVLNAWLNFLIIFLLFLAFLVLVDRFPGMPILAVIPLLVLQTILAIGIGITAGVMNVFFRDVGHLIGIVLQFWFWLTPVIYTVKILPEWASRIVLLNPMTSVVIGYQNILLSNSWPQWASLWPVAAIGAGSCYLGLRLFRNHAGEMIDEL